MDKRWQEISILLAWENNWTFAALSHSSYTEKMMPAFGIGPEDMPLSK